jgi:hypothetical protein
MPYDMTEHRHRFAAWAAARAVQRGWGSSKTEKLRNAIESCGVREFVGSLESPHGVDERRFRELHRQWCCAVIESLTQQGVAAATFGRAAKLVAVYLKVMVVLALLAIATLRGSPIRRSTELNCRKSRRRPGLTRGTSAYGKP